MDGRSLRNIRDLNDFNVQKLACARTQASPLWAANLGVAFDVSLPNFSNGTEVAVKFATSGLISPPAFLAHLQHGLENHPFVPAIFATAG